MSLGQKIYQLRTAKNLSQEALADAMDVSRQSISKWETDASVPELDKLIALSKFFEISLDELVLDQPAKKDSEAATENRASEVGNVQSVPYPEQRAKTWLILLCVGVVVSFFVTLLTSQVLAGLIFACPFILCALVCLVAKRSPWLWCCWLVYLLGDLYIRYATGLNWKSIQMTFIFEPWMNPVRLVIAWVMVAITVLLIFLTVRELAKRKLPEIMKKMPFAGFFWAAFIGSFLPAVIFPERAFALYFVGIDWAQIVLLIVAILSTIAVLRRAKEMAKEE